MAMTHALHLTLLTLGVTLGGCATGTRQVTDDVALPQAQKSRVTRQAITRHLLTLDRAGLVRDTRRGRARVFALDLERLEEAKQYLDHVAAEWDAAAARLRAFVEEER